MVDIDKHSENNSIQNVKTDPLSCSIEDCSGLVLEMSAKSVTVEGEFGAFCTASDPLLLDIRGIAGEHYHLRGCLTPSRKQSVFRFLVVEEDFSTLKDLLGQLRKVQHIRICQSQDVEADKSSNGFEQFQFMPHALSEVSPDEIDTSSVFLGKTFSYPLCITGMTGGVALGAKVNDRLANAAQELNIPMGVGSQRIACENSQYASIFSVKDRYPKVFLIGNLGAAQVLQSDGLDYCKKAVDMIEADALAIHVNLIQECIQVEGDRSFRGLVKRLAEIRKAISKPMVVKEVGCGIDPASAKILNDIGVSAIDVAGKGGTSWGYIEGLRSSSHETAELGKVFRDWGISTAFSLNALRKKLPLMDIVATGGIRNGLEVAKACALGAQMVGVGLPLMRAALESEEKVLDVMKVMIRALEISMLATGSRTLADLNQHLCMGEPLKGESFSGFC